MYEGTLAARMKDSRHRSRVAASSQKETHPASYDDAYSSYLPCTRKSLAPCQHTVVHGTTARSTSYPSHEALHPTLDVHEICLLVPSGTIRSYCGNNGLRRCTQPDREAWPPRWRGTSPECPPSRFLTLKATDLRHRCAFATTADLKAWLGWLMTTLAGRIDGPANVPCYVSRYVSPGHWVAGPSDCKTCAGLR